MGDILKPRLQKGWMSSGTYQETKSAPNI